eukprot:m51a1_g2245 putative serine threonine protein kinase (303) ;mRNA; r:287915-288901
MWSAVPQDDTACDVVASPSSRSPATALRFLWNALSPKTVARNANRTSAQYSRGKSVSRGEYWEDYEVAEKKQQFWVMHRYTDGMPSEAMRRELLVYDTAPQGDSSLCLPRVADRCPDEGWVVLEMPEPAVTLREAKQCMSTGDLVRVWLRVGCAVQKAEALGWHHTELSPDCVYVCASSKRPVLSSWGRATKKVGYHAARDTPRSDLACARSPWQPPEQAAGIVQKHTDVYAWVALLYWILTGKEPTYPRLKCQECTSEVAGAASAESSFFGPILTPDPKARVADLPVLLRVGSAWIAQNYH